MPERLKGILNKVLEWWNKFTIKQKTLIGSITGVVVVALAILIFTVTRPTWITLTVCESETEASEVVELLEGDEIEYKTSSDGLTISVLQKDEADAHLLLGSNSISTDGYSIDDVFDGSFSTTESDKEKKYQLYLEEKIRDDLVDALDIVEDAEVNLSMPNNDGTILSQQEDTYAGVMLTLNDEMTEDQAAGIANFVATSVGNDNTDNILLLDSASNVLFSGADSDSDSVYYTSAAQTAIQKKAQENVKSQVSDVLMGSTLFDNVEVGLNLKLDFDEEEVNDTYYYVEEGNTQGYLDEETTYSEETQGGYSGVPGTDSNDETTYVIDTDDLTYSTVEEVTKDYLPNVKVTTTKKATGTIIPDESSITVVASNYVVYNEDEMKAAGELDDQTFEEFVAANSEKVQQEASEDYIAAVANATGIDQENITLLVYDVPFFQYSENEFDVTDYLQFIIAAAILIMLGFVIFRSTRSQSEEEPEIEPELSVEDLLESTKEEEPILEEIGYAEKSEARVLIEKFIDENPAAVASLLRNWIEDDSSEWD
ncbi:MAG: flagellar biosynthesis protein [Eubacterium sp.]|nr:flagellar biosynthesis protein [Eubacterium sp.]